MTEHKIICRVPGCNRGMMKATAVKRWGHSNVSLICGHHWRRLTKAERRVWARIKRIQAKYGPEATLDREIRIWRALTRRAGE